MSRKTKHYEVKAPLSHTVLINFAEVAKNYFGNKFYEIPIPSQETHSAKG
jgi:hypothetical protein